MIRLLLTGLPLGLLLSGCLDEPAPIASTAQVPTSQTPSLSSQEVKSLNQTMLAAAAEGKTDMVLASLVKAAEINAKINEEERQ